MISFVETESRDKQEASTEEVLRTTLELIEISSKVWPRSPLTPL